jgi:hypothetical protein
LKSRISESEKFTEGKGGCDEYSADTLETIGKGSWIGPVASAKIAVVFTASWATTADTDTNPE